MSGVALVTVATSLVLFPLYYRKGKKTTAQVSGDGESIKSVWSLYTLVPVTLVEPGDGVTIIVWINGKIETVRNLFIDTPETKNQTCVFNYAMEAYIRNSKLLKSGELTIEFEKGTLGNPTERLSAYVYVYGKSILGTLFIEGYTNSI